MTNLQALSSERKNKRLELAVLLWFITLPFGAYIGGVSLGILTIYPNLVLTLLLFAYVGPSMFKWRKIYLVYFAFLIVWFAYGLLFPVFGGIDFGSEWKFDIKSLGMQFLFSGVVFGSFFHLGKQRFFNLLKSGILYFLGILLFSGCFEYYTGIHLTGRFTDKLLIEEVVSDTFYAPVFVYDNRNDYLAYFIGMVAIFLSLWNRWKDVKWGKIALFFIGFLFAKISYSRIAIFIFSVLIIIQLVHVVVSHYQSGGKMNLFIVGSGVALFLVLGLTNKIFIGPRFVEGELNTQGEYVEFPKAKGEKLSSDDKRINLVLNSVDFLKEKPLTGIGPGQFRKRHLNKEVSHPTDTVVGAHNYPLEIITQYGLVAWAYLSFLIYLFFKQIREYWRNRTLDWRIALLPIFGVISLMPSSFLYLDLNWFFVPIAFLILTETNTNLEHE